MDRILTGEEIAKYYPLLYQKCFDIKSPKNYPPVVIIGYDDKTVWGFTGGFAWNDAVFYISATGLIPEYRNKKNARKLSERAEEYYKALGFLNVTGYIENTNKRAIVTALMSGYTITGSILGRDGKTSVIVSKEI